MATADPKGDRIKELEIEAVTLKERLTEKCAALTSSEKAIEEKNLALTESAVYIRKLKMFVDKLTSAPNPYATVISKIEPAKEGEDHKLVIFTQSQYMEVNVPGKTNEEVKDFFEKVRRGTVLKMAMETMQPFAIVPAHESLGPIVTVRKVLDGYVEIEDGEKGGVKVVLSGEHKLETGDRVVLDHHGLIVAKNLGKEEKRFVLQNTTNVRWEDIGGLDEVRQTITDMIEKPIRYPEIYAKYRKNPPKGILLYGPPGNGKTLIAKGIATSIAQIFGADASTGFLHVKGPEILSKWVGEAEATIRSIFERCRAHKKEHGYPATVFIDEADAILGKRGTGVSSDMEKTIVPMFLAEMDGLDDSAAIIILATNRPDILDPAVIREGRVDRKIKIGRPNKDAAASIWKIHISKKPAAEGQTVEALAMLGASELYSENRPLYEIERKSGGKVTVTLGHVVNGAMIASIVEDAASMAINHDIEKGVFTGVRPENVVSAIDRLYADHRHVSHKDEIEDLTANWKSDVKSVTKIH
jgi:proteasome-associated ATPase